MKICNNPSLENFTVTFLDTAIADLEIKNNNNLLSLNGLNSFTRVFRLYISDNTLLNSISDLTKMTMTDQIFIINNDSLVSLDGLNSLESKGSQDYAYIYISGNAALKDFCSLKSIVSNEDFKIEILNNLYNPSFTDISNNNCRIK